jgi:hypothetical protein
MKIYIITAFSFFVILCIALYINHELHQKKNELSRLAAMIGPNPTLARINHVFGAADAIYSGNGEYKQEMFYGKLSSTENVVIIIENDDSIQYYFSDKNQ